jgi:uncharacterized membrane protein
MLLAAFVVVGLTAVAAIVIVSRNDHPLAGAHAARVHGASPVDEAERILSQRYAHGEITAEEYDRMMVILRR